MSFNNVNQLQAWYFFDLALISMVLAFPTPSLLAAFLCCCIFSSVEEVELLIVFCCLDSSRMARSIRLRPCSCLLVIC